MGNLNRSDDATSIQFKPKSFKPVIKKISKVDVTPQRNYPHVTIYLGNHLLPVLSNKNVADAYYGGSYAKDSDFVRDKVSPLFFVIAEAFNLPYKLKLEERGINECEKMYDSSLLDHLPNPFSALSPKKKKTQCDSGPLVYASKNSAFEKLIYPNRLPLRTVNLLDWFTVSNSESLSKVKNIILESTIPETLGYIPAWILVYSPGKGLTEKKIVHNIKSQLANILDTMSWGSRPEIVEKDIIKIAKHLLENNKPRIMNIFNIIKKNLIPKQYTEFEKKLMMKLLSFNTEQKILWQSYKGTDSFKGKDLMPKGAHFNYLAGGGAVKYDYYENKIELPPGLTCEDWIRGFSTKANKYLDTSLSKNPYSNFSSFYPWDTNHGVKNKVSRAGDILDIDVWGPNDASVMISEIIYDDFNSEVTFSTMEMSYLDPKFHDRSDYTKGALISTTGSHVVSGNRIWGFRKDKETGELYCYTIGLSKNIDKKSASMGEFAMAWNSWVIWSDGAINDAEGIQNLNWISFHISNNQFLKGKFLEQKKLWTENVFYNSKMTTIFADGGIEVDRKSFPTFRSRFYKSYNIKHDTIYRNMK